jgi:hypothetical protein
MNQSCTLSLEGEDTALGANCQPDDPKKQPDSRRLDIEVQYG